MKSKYNALQWFVCAAMAIALISFYMPFVATGRYYTYSSTGFELLEMAMEDGGAGFLVIGLVGTVAGLITALMYIKRNSRYVLPLVLSAVSCGSVWLYFSEGMDYVTNGFWLYILSHVASVVLCGIICANTKSFFEDTDAASKENTN